MPGLARSLLIRPLVLCGLLLLGAAGQPGFGATAVVPMVSESQAERAFELLERMSLALKTTDFEGTFVYQFGDALSAMRIVHQYRDGALQESLLTLTGPIRTIGRSGGVVACLLSGGQSVLLNSSRQNQPQGSVGQLTPPDWRQLSTHYGFELLETTRVAGRAVDVVNIIPMDSLRYGYRFSIDRETALPLRIALIDERGRPIQQIMFTEVRPFLRGAETVRSAAGESEAPLTGAATGGPVMETLLSARDPQRPGAAVTNMVDQSAETRSRWSFSQLPPGFVLQVHEWIEFDGGSPIEHFLFSDGLASVSLYVEPEDQSGLVGQTRMASIHAAGKWLAEHQIIAVGEVPSATVTAVLDAIDVTDTWADPHLTESP